SGLVLSYLASALQFLPTEKRWELAGSLVARSDWAEDRTLPLMIWYGLRHAVADDSSRAAHLVFDSRVPLVTRLVTRRLAENLQAHRSAMQYVATRLPSATPQKQHDVLSGMYEALRGVRRADPPEGWAETLQALRQGADDPLRQLLERLAVVFG